MHDAGLRKAGIVSMVSAELTLSSLAALDEYYIRAPNYTDRMR